MGVGQKGWGERGGREGEGIMGGGGEEEQMQIEKKNKKTKWREGDKNKNTGQYTGNAGVWSENGWFMFLVINTQANKLCQMSSPWTYMGKIINHNIIIGVIVNEKKPNMQ